MEEKDLADIREVIRWKTQCCGYMFNTSTANDLPLENEPLIGSVSGAGYWIVGECPGCGESKPQVEKY